MPTGPGASTGIRRRCCRPSRTSSVTARRAPWTSGALEVRSGAGDSRAASASSVTPAGGRGRRRGRMPMSAPTTLMAWISMLLGRRAAGRDQPVGFRPVLVSRKSRRPVQASPRRRAQGRWISIDPRRGRGRFGFAAEPSQHPASPLVFLLGRHEPRPPDRPLLSDALHGHKIRFLQSPSICRALVSPLSARPQRRPPRRGPFGRTASAARSVPRSATPRRRGSSAG